MKLLVILAVGIAAVVAFPAEDPVIAKFDDKGLRYQYVVGPDGPQLVDLWLKRSDLAELGRFDPNASNGYHLFTRNNPSISQPIPLGADFILQNSNYDSSKKTVFLIHGWLNNPTSVFNVQLVYAYLAAEDVNVFIVDWSVGALASYVVAIQNVVLSGGHVARFISWLTVASGVSFDDIHVIGHSLGGQQSGIVGRNLAGQVAYITGRLRPTQDYVLAQDPQEAYTKLDHFVPTPLPHRQLLTDEKRAEVFKSTTLDPSLPGWIFHEEAFTPDVGVYTEIMHTDAGIAGLVGPAADVDFYPNGGRGMPGCSDSNCDHHRCVFYMAESLMTGGFTGRSCNTLTEALTQNCTGTDTLKMGGSTPKTGRTGMFHLPTNAQPPFSLG